MGLFYCGKLVKNVEFHCILNPQNKVMHLIVFCDSTHTSIRQGLSFNYKAIHVYTMLTIFLNVNKMLRFFWNFASVEVALLAFTVKQKSCLCDYV